MRSSLGESARGDHGDGGLDAFAGWIEGLMRRRGYDIDNPRGGGKSKLADDAGVHRAAVSRLLQRQSMPDLETMRRLAGVLGVPLRDMLIRSGRLTEEDLPLPGNRRVGGAEPTGRMTPEEAARRMEVPVELRELFVNVARQFLPERGGTPGADALGR
ncbi:MULTISPECIES: helix-turn-helix domain-containing protein [Streptomyces]|uniref:DNA-binding protein n=2 Tax=Streptomyces TaxID=1883 RepID=A0A0W7X430_9ACTN|nr:MULTISPECIES: helix-turn-helix transcriptional regulator [Streptomyces]KUF17544.1 DNA-binding protein [Streptomyces silvensis]MVO83866.1 helix-turn-helix domain-containing protein [Streptomyces typhae]